MTEQTLLAAIACDPADALAWLALADWLEEAGHEPRAELVRLTRSLLTMSLADERRSEAEGRQWALLEAGVRPCLPRRELTHGVQVVLIPAGTFWLGSPPGERNRDDNEEQREAVIERPFWLGTTPVTQAQFRAVIGRNPSAVYGPEAGDMDPRPVELVEWEDALSFCALMDARLPTEDEWEYACRAGTSGPHYCGPVDDVPSAFRAGAVAAPSAVGLYPPNGFGLHDMLGNVWEMTGHFPDLFETARAAVRGGCYQDVGGVCRAAKRLTGMEDDDSVQPGADLGFRVAVDWRPGR